MSRPPVLHLEPARYPDRLRAELAECCDVDYREVADVASLRAALAERPWEAVFVRLGLYLGEAELDLAPALRHVITPTTGTDHLDEAAMAARGIALVSLRGETEFLRQIRSTSEHTWALLLALLRHLPAATRATAERGEWLREPYLAGELFEKRLGIYGLGRLGRIVAGYGEAFGMAVAFCEADEENAAAAPAQWRRLSAEDLFSQSDILSIHLPLNADTRGIVGEALLSRLPHGAIVVNTARGELIDEPALARRLETGQIAGAGLDVLSGDSAWSREADSDNPLLALARAHPRRVLVTPHMGGYAAESIERTRAFVLRAFKDRLLAVQAPATDRSRTESQCT